VLVRRATAVLFPAGGGARERAGARAGRSWRLLDLKNGAGLKQRWFTSA
jgi:hypothetical protein